MAESKGFAESVKEGVAGAGEAIGNTVSAAKDYVTSKGEEGTQAAKEDAKAAEQEHYEEKAKDDDTGLLDRGANALKAAGAAVEKHVAGSKKDDAAQEAEAAKDKISDNM